MSLISCGRRGDPVPISPIDETIIKGAGKEVNVGEESSISEDTDTEITQPDIPTGITALFTGKTVVITWDDISDQGVKLYRVYRSSGDEFILIGDTVAPAFTDVQIELNAEYHYRVTAVGHSESGTSEEIKIITRLD
jgi:fibronectin type 3 domain-containing protein